MAYIGRQNLGGAYRQLDDISSGFDGSDTTHTMQVNSQNVTVGDVNQIILSLGGVIQKPGTDFTVSGSTLTFTTAPAANTSFFAILLGSDNGGTVTPTDSSVTTAKIAADAITSAKIADDAVTGDHIASSGAFAIGAAGTSSSIAGLPVYVDSSSNSVYTHDVSGTDNSAENNTAFGLNAADAITTADSVTVFGRSAGSAITTGSSSTFFGKEAGLAVTEGTNNIFMGVNAGHDVTTGGSNIAIGATAYDGCDTESHNIAIGRDALGGSIAGAEYNVAIGNYAADALTSGDHNVIIGDNAGTDMTTAGQNVLVGSYAGTNLTTGATQRVHLIGYASGFYMTDESYNIGIGNSSLGGANINGAEYNVAIGAFTGDALTTGDYNVLIGYNTGDSMTSGQKNICVGVNAGSGITTADDCTLIGHNAGFDALRSTTTGDGDLVVGSNSTANAFVKVSFNVGSDMRDKTDIEDLPNAAGLNFINQIRPVTYVWDNRDNYYSHTHEKYGWRDHSKKSTKVHTGFVAQEIKELEKSIGWEDDHIVDTSDEKSFTLKYDRFVPSLVKAVQELSAEIEELKTKLKET